MSRVPLKVGWFSTANGPGSLGMLEAVLSAIDAGTLDAKLEFVFVNRERGQTAATDHYMDLIESRGIPLVAFSSRKFRRSRENAVWSSLREDFDSEVLSRLSDYSPDVALQAGYMLYAPVLCQSLLMLNQHPALPGGAVGRWQDAVWDSIETRASEAGSIVHISTPDLDRGPVVSFCRFNIAGPGWHELWTDAVKRPDDPAERKVIEQVDPLFNAIRRAGLARERPHVVRTLAAIASGEISSSELRSQEATGALDLTDVVEADVKAQAGPP